MLVYLKIGEVEQGTCHWLQQHLMQCMKHMRVGLQFAICSSHTCNGGWETAESLGWVAAGRRLLHAGSTWTGNAVQWKGMKGVALHWLAAAPATCN